MSRATRCTTLSGRRPLPRSASPPCVVIGRINYARFRGVAKIALGISIALLVAVIIPGVGITSHGATRWLGIPGTTMRFQPSEIAKLGVILYFADSISKKTATK